MPGHPGTPPTLPSPSSGSSRTFLAARVVRLSGTVPGRVYRGAPGGSRPWQMPAPSVTARFPPRRQGAVWPPAVAAGSCSHVGPPAPHGNGGGGPGRAVSMAALPPRGAGHCSPSASLGCTLRVPPLGRRALVPPALPPRPLRPIAVPEEVLRSGPGPLAGPAVAVPGDPVGPGRGSGALCTRRAGVGGLGGAPAPG